MIEINLNNIEELIFFDKNIQKQLPEFSHLFHQYRLAKMTPVLKTLGQKSVVDLLNGLKPEHMEIIRNYFNEEVTLTNIDYHIVKNIESSCDELEINLQEIEWLNPQFCIDSNGNQVYLSVWR